MSVYTHNHQNFVRNIAQHLLEIKVLLLVDLYVYMYTVSVQSRTGALRDDPGDIYLWHHPGILGWCNILEMLRAIYSKTKS